MAAERKEWSHIDKVERTGIDWVQGAAEATPRRSVALRSPIVYQHNSGLDTTRRFHHRVPVGTLKPACDVRRGVGADITLVIGSEWWQQSRPP